MSTERWKATGRPQSMTKPSVTKPIDGANAYDDDAINSAQVADAGIALIESMQKEKAEVQCESRVEDSGAVFI